MSKSSVTFRKPRTPDEIGAFPVGKSVDDFYLAADRHPGVEFRCEFKRIRNARFHRKVMAFLHEAFEGQEDYEHFEQFREAMKVACGWVEFTTVTVRESVLAKYAMHLDSCATQGGYDPYNSSPVECTCRFEQALNADTQAVHIKTKSQSFGECTDEEAADLWERAKRWVIEQGYMADERVREWEWQ